MRAFESIRGIPVRDGAKAAEVAKLIDVERCELTTIWSVFNDTSVRDNYVRSLPGGDWVHWGYLPEATSKALDAAIKAGRFDADGKLRVAS